MTPNELTTIVAEPLGRQFDVPFKLMIFEKAMVFAAQFIRQTLERDPRRRQEMIRSVVVNPGDIIPQTIYANGRVFDYVGSEDGTKPFTFVSSFSKIQFLESSKFSRPENKYYTLVDSAIQIFKQIGKPKIRIDAVFTDLEEVLKLNSKESGVDFWNEDLRLPDDVISLTLKELAKYTEIEPRENEQETTAKDT